MQFTATATTNYDQKQLSCCWDGRTMLHNSNSEKMELVWFIFWEKSR